MKYFKVFILGVLISCSSDWRVFANVQNNATNIKNRINRDPGQVGFMPRVGSMSAEEIAIISCWVDEGAMDN
mgnify:CR=1 FL=1